MGRRLAASLGAAAFLVLAVASGPGTGPARAQAPAQHRAAVIIDTGQTVKHVCIRFTADSISGKDALDLANQVDPSVQPVYQDYGSLGAFVCSLCGVGNPQGDCTGKQSGEYWAYDRAPAGTTQFSTSSLGVSSTQVHDGDVEGWRWGTGGAPPYASVDQICGTVSTDGTFTPTSITYDGGPAQPIPGGSAAPRGSRQPARSPAPAAPGAAPTTTTTSSITGGAAGEESTTSSSEASQGPTGTALARTPKHAGGSGGGGSLVGLGVFGAVGAGLGAWYWRLRRLRGAP